MKSYIHLLPVGGQHDKPVGSEHIQGIVLLGQARAQDSDTLPKGVAELRSHATEPAEANHPQGIQVSIHCVDCDPSTQQQQQRC